KELAAYSCGRSCGFGRAIAWPHRIPISPISIGEPKHPIVVIRSVVSMWPDGFVHRNNRGLIVLRPGFAQNNWCARFMTLWRGSGGCENAQRTNSDTSRDESALLIGRQADDLTPAIHRLEIVDVLLRTLPAVGNFQ